MKKSITFLNSLVSIEKIHIVVTQIHIQPGIVDKLLQDT
jgi:hypothetical protein